MFKNEKNMLKRSETLMNIRRIENIKEYEINKQKEFLAEKYRKSLQFKEQKNNIMSLKRNLSLDTSNKRQSLINKFEDFEKNNALEVLFY